jgi:fibro-slime domain-containing protein
MHNPFKSFGRSRVGTLASLAAGLTAAAVVVGGVNCGVSPGPKTFTSSASGAGGGHGGSGAGGMPSTNTTGMGGMIHITGTGGNTLCGNGMLDPGEQCDDGILPADKVDGGKDDGCNALCQIEAGWSCPTAGKPCVNNNTCGNGIVTPSKQCDDGNTMNGDGCSSTCMLEAGWICKVPGRPCEPLCGDGKVELGKQCDDGNTMNGDGCSATCRIEPGWSCTGMPSVCTKAVCGNGKLETGESCDCGTDPNNLPMGCTGPNGLFNGDGTGCSNTCTKEPICRGTAGTGTTHACATTCGNGNIEPGEQCDDGNMVSGDGCSSTCMTEPGFTCTTAMKPDTQMCTQAIYSGQCLELPVKIRDFRSEHDTNGHPDFFYYGATVANPVNVAGVLGGPATLPFSKRYCVPNSAGPARKNDATARAWDIAQANLDNNGRPVFNASRAGSGGATLADCQFTDWSIGGNGGHVSGYTMTNSPLNGLTFVGGLGQSGNAMYRGPAPIVSTAASFGQWWTDNTYTNNTHVVSTLELGSVGNNLYRYSSAPHSVYGGYFPLDPAANNFPIYSLTGGTTGGPGTVLTAANGEALHCDLWPYWYPGFGGANCKADQYIFAPGFSPTVPDPGTWFGQNPNGGWIAGAQGWFHDSWFSVEARYLFTFNNAFDLQFFGDDDTFVFINGVLVIDLGGVHQRLPATVHVDATGNATIQEGGNIYMTCTGTGCPASAAIPGGSVAGDIVPCNGGKDPVTGVAFNSTCAAGNTTCDCRQRTLTAAQLGLMPNNTYEIAVFERDGHPPESNFQLTLSGFTTTESTCQPKCGDGIVSGGEECDCGDMTVTTLPMGCTQNNSDTAYNGCTTKCTYGPFCGDGVVQNPPEACDNGTKMNTASYGMKGGCTPSCQFASYCGDGVVDTSDGEQCDLGAKNGQTGSGCDATCHIVIMTH